MRIFKLALFLASAMLASQGKSFDLTPIAIKAAAGLLPEAQVHYKPNKSAQQADVRLPPATGNFADCRENFANGEPPKVPGQHSVRALCFSGFAVLHSAATKTPLYSAEVLTRDRVQAARGESRTDVFFEDARLPARERATLDDYRGSTYDRGHTSPAGDMGSESAMAQSFSLANIVPQAPENNRFAWADIEKATRKYVNRAKGSVYVITGPVFDPQACPFVKAAAKQLQHAGIEVPESPARIVADAAHKTGFRAPYRYDAQACTIGAGVAVPSHLYKLVYDSSTNRAWAHWLENTDWARVSAPISYDELVRRTGIDFLPGVRPQN